MAAVMSNKRKRESIDHGGPENRTAPGFTHPSPGPSAAHDFDYPHMGADDNQFAEMLTQHNNTGHEHPNHDSGNANGQSATDTATAALHQYSMQVPQSTAEAFLQQHGAEGDPRPSGASFDMGSSNSVAHQPNIYPDLPNLDPLKEGQQQAQTQPQPHEASPTGTSSGPKPAVGSDEWHKVRRDNHKEVERRRRETINEGINELAKIVPGCEKNKGSILARAVQFITQLKENESQNIEKWTLEKLLTEQAIAELSSSCDKLKTELARTYNERKVWKKLAKRAGISDPTEEEWKELEAEDEE